MLLPCCRFSPSGTRLAFTAAQKDESYLFTIQTDGSGLRRLEKTMPRTVVNWLPDGHKIAFEGPAGDIRLIDLRKGGSRRLIADPRSPSWLANGRSLLISRARTIYDSIYLISKNGGKPLFITDGQNPSQQTTQPKTNR